MQLPTAAAVEPREEVLEEPIAGGAAVVAAHSVPRANVRLGNRRADEGAGYSAA